MPTFELVTTSPNTAVLGQAFPYANPHSGHKLTCGGSAPALTQVQLAFGPCGSLATPPVTAALVITPAVPTAAPVQITMVVHRWVSWCQYLWVPLCCGLGLALLFVLAILAIGLPDPASGKHPRRGRPVKVHGPRILSLPIYAAGTWTFGGSWATNVTAGGAVVAGVLTATGTVSELLPGVELGRFSLLIAVAGGITVAAPLVFGALNFRFLRADPTTAGVSVIELPDQAKPAEIAVPAGATITVSGGATIPAREAPAPAAVPPPQAWWQRLLPCSPHAAPSAAGQPPPAGGDFTELPARTEAVLRSGAALSVPPGATISVLPQQTAPFQVLALPGASDIEVFAGGEIRVSPGVTIAAADVTVAPADPSAAPSPSAASRTSPEHPAYCLKDYELPLPGGAKISFLGRATLSLPAKTLVTAPGGYQPGSARRSHLKTPRAFPLPHTNQVIESLMWSLLIASFLTLFGTGAELGILGVLTLTLSAASFKVRVLCVVLTAIAAAVVWLYSVVSIRALADPMPGDALTATGGTAFML